MKLTTWNCARGFEKKKNAIFSTDSPDIAVIQECSRKSTESNLPNGYSACWVGDNPNIGMGVFYRQGVWNVRRLEETTNEIRWVVPFEVKGPENFTLIAVWACEVEKNKRDSYVGQLKKAMENHSKWFTSGAVVVAGDFNSNTIFDKERRDWNHSTMVGVLRDHGLSSVYHTATREEHGQEKIPTFHLQKDREKPFHLDYIFVPNDWSGRWQMTVSVDYQLPPLSDHRPVNLRLSPPVV
jgi:exodeoxyribonuclease-3